MYEPLSKYPLYFPSRDDASYTLKDFLNHVIKQGDRKHQLPTIVNITSLNNDHGRSMKGLLSKNCPLLLLDIHELHSILAEYHRSAETRSHSHRLRMASKASSKFRNMKKLSRSLVSLTSVTPEDDERVSPSAGEEISSNQRDLIKRLTEKRSTAIPLCRVPISYRGLFELLNENDQAIEPSRRLSDLIRTDLSTQVERWPPAFLLRASSIGYSKSLLPESSDSCYGSASDLDLPKNVVLLADEGETIPAGQILTVLTDCYGHRTRPVDKEVKEPSPASPTVLAWPKGRSLLTFWKKRRPSPHSDSLSTDSSSQRSISGKTEAYLKCRVPQGDVIYLPLDESGLFSALNNVPGCSKSLSTSNEWDLSGVYPLKCLLSLFRFPISVRLPDLSLSFDNLYAPAVIQRSETFSKLRLLMPYDEQVVFACPLHFLSSKSSKSPSSLVVVPLSINADIQIQPCLNMTELVDTDAFIHLVQSCVQIIAQYMTDPSLVHFPLQLTNNTLRHQQPLYRKRSQSTAYINFEASTARERLRHSDEQLNKIYSNSDESSSLRSAPLRYRESVETVKQKLSTDGLRQRTMGPFERANDDEDYEDVDKIYDYVRSGDITDDVQKIQEKELAANTVSSLRPRGSVSSKETSLRLESRDDGHPSLCQDRRARLPLV